MAIKKKPEEHENHERWLVSYADFITLLFAFFVVMYSTADRDTKKIKQLQMSLTKSFGSHDSGPMEHQNGRPFTSMEDERYAPIANNMVSNKGGQLPPEKLYDEEEPLRKLEFELVALINSEGASRGLHLMQAQKGLIIGINESVLFEEKRPKIRAEFVSTMERIAKRLRTLPNDFRIEGITIDVPGKSKEKGQEILNSQIVELTRFLTEDGQINESRIESSQTTKSQYGYVRAEDIGDGSILDLVVIRKIPE